MLEMMLMGKGKDVITAKQLLVTGLGDFLTKTAVYPVYGKDDQYLYLVNDPTGDVYRAPLADLVNGVLNFTTIVKAGPVVGRLNSIAPYHAASEKLMFIPAEPYNRQLHTLSKSGVVTANAIDMMPGYQYSYGLGQAIVDDVFYYYGGYTQQTPVPTMAVYRTTGGAGVLDSTGPLPAPRAYGCHTTDGVDIYTVGGLLTPTGSSYPLSDELWRYSPRTHRWTKLASLPKTLRLSGCCEIIKGKLYVYGGLETSNGTVPSQTLYVYDIATDKWDALPFPEIGYRYAQMGFQYNDKFYVLGGWSSPALGITATRAGDLWEINV